jgi:MoaA/NifB/PqqE/SkfB family radical SAM enzyme
VRPKCKDSLLALGAHKVHWECWSDCNLACGFCYRTRGVPLETPDALRLLAAVKTAGSSTIVFAGGDPTLRRDLAQLVGRARELGLVVEIHTNSQFSTTSVRRVLAEADCVGLSLDGSTRDVHDLVRSKRGNFDRVLELLAFLDQARVPVIVRTVVVQPNHDRLLGIGDLLRSHSNVIAWYLLEFSPIGLGFQSRRMFEIERERFDAVADAATRRYGVELQIHARRLEDKSGAYVMITPDGDVYGTSGDTEGGVYPRVGSVLRDHLSDLAAAVGFEPVLHEPRFAIVEEMRRRTLERMASGR